MERPAIRLAGIQPEAAARLIAWAQGRDKINAQKNPKIPLQCGGFCYQPVFALAMSRHKTRHFPVFVSSACGA
jgi:hypothetical protein